MLIDFRNLLDCKYRDRPTVPPASLLHLSFFKKKTLAPTEDWINMAIYFWLPKMFISVLKIKYQHQK